MVKNKIEDEKHIHEANLPMLHDKKKNTVGNVHKRARVNTTTSEGKMVFFGDTNWNLVLNMMLGIQMAVRSVKGFQEMIYE